MQASVRATNQKLIYNQCILEKMIQQSILHQAEKHAGLAALSITGEYGWIITRAGSVVVLRRCRDIVAIVSPLDTCNTDIPIQSNSTAMPLFMDPVTRIIKHSSHAINCQDDANPVINIRNTSYKFTPDITIISHLPALPSLLTKLNTTLVRPGTGLYPQEVLRRMDNELPHMSRKEEVKRQLIKLGTRDFQVAYDHQGVMGSLVDYVVDSGPSKWLLISSLVISTISMICAVCLWFIIIKSKLWVVLKGNSAVYRYQAALLGAALEEGNK